MPGPTGRAALALAMLVVGCRSDEPSRPAVRPPADAAVQDAGRPGFDLTRAECTRMAEHLYTLMTRDADRAQDADRQRDALLAAPERCVSDVSRILYECALRATSHQQFLYCSP